MTISFKHDVIVGAKANNPKVEVRFVLGSHMVHLNYPERVLPILQDWMERNQDALAENSKL